jgi:hypothetical protein
LFYKTEIKKASLSFTFSMLSKVSCLYTILIELIIEFYDSFKDINVPKSLVKAEYYPSVLAYWTGESRKTDFDISIQSSSIPNTNYVYF